MWPGRPPGRRPSGRERRFTLGRAPDPPPARTLPWRGVSTLLGVLALGVVLGYGVLWATQGDTFRVQHIAIEGVEVTSANAIVRAANLDGALLFTLDGGAAAERIEALDSVKSATVSRSWPSTVRIDIVEHQAWGYWQIGGDRVAVDREGQRLVASRPAPPDAPTIIEFAAPQDLEGGIAPDRDAVTLAALLIEDPSFAAAEATPVAFIFERDRGLTVHFDNAPSVVFGDSSSYEYKLAAWREVRDEIAARALVVAEIDLRFSNQVVLR